MHQEDWKIEIEVWLRSIIIGTEQKNFAFHGSSSNPFVFDVYIRYVNILQFVSYASLKQVA